MMKTKKLLFMVFTLACFTAAGVCLIVNMATDRQITWAAYPILSIPFGWAALLPLLVKKHRVILFLFALTLLPFPYLYFLSKITPVTDWFMPVGLPSAVVGVISLWILFPLFRFVKINLWYKSAVSVFLLGVVGSTAVNYFVDIYLGAEPFMWYRYINIFSCIAASGVLGILGYKKSESKSADTQ